MPNFSTMRRTVTLGLALAMAASMAPSSLAQDGFLDRLNKRPLEIAENRRADKIMLEPMSKMTPPPAEVQADLEAGPAWLLVDPSVAGRWAKMEAWAQAEPQRAVLAALSAATKQYDRSEPGMGWGMPYGATAEAADAVRLDLHVDLGSEEPTIAEADVRYLRRLHWVEQLAHVEATRLMAEGKIGDAINVIIDVFYLGRELADRELSVEVHEGFRIMTLAMSRIRDVAYEDYRGQRRLDIAALRALIKRIDDEQFQIQRIRFPEGEKLAIDQLIARVFEGSPDPEQVGSLFARIATRDQPLKIFNESAKWSKAAGTLGDRRENEDVLDRAYSDWSTRWAVDPFDPRMRVLFEYSRVSKTKYPLMGLLPDLTDLFDLRRVVQTEIVGTRAALGLLGYFYEQRAFARVITSARPDWMSAKEADPFNPDTRDRGGVPAMKYTRPVTDDPQKKPHLMTVVTGSGYNFRLELDDSVWMLWSVGSNSTNDQARYVQNTATRVTNADYIIWPPIESLTRQHLKDMGELK